MKIYLRGDLSKAVIVCDECGVQPDGFLPVGLWNLDCGHKLCSDCYAYAEEFGIGVHRDVCPRWKVGAA